MAKEFSLDDLDKELKKDKEDFGDRMDKSTISEVDEWIHTGNYALNAQLSGHVFGGFPSNRSLALSGVSGSGKTYLLLNMVREAINKGYVVIFYDSENAVDKGLMEKFNIDTTKVRYTPVNTIQEFRTKITKTIELLVSKKREGYDVGKVMFALDSAGQLASQKEVEDAASGSDKSDMTRAKMTKSIFRIIIGKMAHIKAPFIFTNHSYATMDLYPQQVQSGGTGPEYSASIILQLSKSKLKEKNMQTGIIVRSKPNKQRFVKPYEISFYIHYTKGMNPYIGLEKFLDWKNCGVARGRILTQKDVNKLSKDKQAELDSWDIFDDDGNVKETLYFQEDKNAKKVVVKHLNDSIQAKDLWTDKVFTNEVLQGLDHVMKPYFSYGENDLDENGDILDELDEQISDDEENED